MDNLVNNKNSYEALEYANNELQLTACFGFIKKLGTYPNLSD